MREPHTNLDARISIRSTKTFAERLKEKAKQQDMKVSDIIRCVVEDYLDNDSIDPRMAA